MRRAPSSTTIRPCRDRDLRADGLGQERGRRGGRAADPGRARLGRRDAGLPRAADPDQPVRRRGSSATSAWTRRARSPSTSGSRTRRSTRSSPPAGRRSSSAAPASTCAPRSPTSSCRRRPRRARASGSSDSYDELGAEQAHELLAERDPAAAAAVHANDRRRVVRALELAEAGSSLRPAARPALGRRDAAPDADRRPRRPAARSSSGGSRSARARCSSAGSRRRFSGRSPARSRRPPAPSTA